MGTTVGVISGNLVQSPAPTLPVAWVGGQGMILGPDGSAEAVNAWGVIVGVQNHHATRWTSAGSTRLDRPGTVSSIALALNDGGTTTGSVERTDGRRQAFVWLEGQGMQLLPYLPGDTNSEGVGVRADGMVFGNSWNDFAARTVRWSHQAGRIVVEDLLTLVDAPGWVLETLLAVGAGGDVAGVGKLNGVRRAFLLEPTSTGLVAQ